MFNPFWQLSRLVILFILFVSFGRLFFLSAFFASYSSLFWFSHVVPKRKCQRLMHAYSNVGHVHLFVLLFCWLCLIYLLLFLFSFFFFSVLAFDFTWISIKVPLCVLSSVYLFIFVHNFENVAFQFWISECTGKLVFCLRFNSFLNNIVVFEENTQFSV